MIVVYQYLSKWFKESKANTMAFLFNLSPQ